MARKLPDFVLRAVAAKKETPVGKMPVIKKIKKTNGTDAKSVVVAKSSSKYNKVDPEMTMKELEQQIAHIKKRLQEMQHYSSNGGART